MPCIYRNIYILPGQLQRKRISGPEQRFQLIFNLIQIQILALLHLTILSFNNVAGIIANKSNELSRQITTGVWPSWNIVPHMIIWFIVILLLRYIWHSYFDESTNEEASHALNAFFRELSKIGITSHLPFTCSEMTSQ